MKYQNLIHIAGTVTVIVIVVGAFLPLIVACTSVAFPAPVTDRSGVVSKTESTSFEALGLSVEVLATGLDTPWDLVWGPDGHLWVTERPGRIVRIDPLTGASAIVANVESVERGESGLMGMAFHPEFDQFPFVYLSHSYSDGEAIANALIRMEFDGTTLNNQESLLSEIEGAMFHDGSRLAFGPDGFLYMTTGDARDSESAQDIDSLSGKILRLDLDGRAAAMNPFGNEIFSYGHRNAQGLVFHPVTGMPYITEHGPRDNDEVSIVYSGANYGWPIVRGFVDDDVDGESDFDRQNPVTEPIAAWTPTVAPAGADFYRGGAGSSIDGWEGNLLFVTLKGQSLVRLILSDDGEQVLGQQIIAEGLFGRLRDVLVGPDGAIYLATSNRDGRGRPKPDDDKILVIRPH